VGEVTPDSKDVAPLGNSRYDLTITEPAAPATERWTAQWKELYTEVITTGLCTGCAGCVVTCPHDVIGYEHEEGKYIPFHLEEELGLDNCIHGEKGCTTCTRACPRFRAWEPAADMHLFGKVREPDQMAGIWQDLWLTRASDERPDPNRPARPKTSPRCRVKLTSWGLCAPLKPRACSKTSPRMTLPR
jgi:coenzyme F420 hydrogenase subunit beta